MSFTDADVAILPDPRALIGGKRFDDTSAELIPHLYTATGNRTVDVPAAGAGGVDAAVADARAAAPEWRSWSPDARRRVLLRLAQLIEEKADQLTEIQIVENGTPRGMASVYAPLSADCLQYYAGWADKIEGDVHPVWPAAALDYSVLEPYGVVAIIIPWNSPLFSVGSILAPALAAGNCVVVKPPESTPFTSLRFAELALEAGIPAGVLNVIPGSGVAGSALVSHPGIDKIHFTGSGPTAQRIIAAAAANFTPVGLELGGKSPNIIFADADLDRAVPQAVIASLQLSGQACVAGTRLLVQDEIYDEVVERCAAQIIQMPVGDPAESSTFFGPLISAAARERVLGFIDRASSQGNARIVTGGSAGTGDLSDGFYVEPTLVADVDPGAEVAKEEVFGPVLAALRFRDEDEAVRLANDSPYGLAAYVQTTDGARAHRVSAAVEAGVVWVNGLGGLPPAVPFGGYKHSGVGRLGGRFGLEEFSRRKNVWMAL
ncbi:aldehyde dehydrogenase family protein [Nocardia rhamnosiphila]|uniref:Aldehyde dehydrogenase family protein n=1 Tax=Nocardia rhamnosiphila TaxID=426716 RepID=A0ABV2WYU8_9NOCA